MEASLLLERRARRCREPSGPKVTGAWRRAETTGGCKINLSLLAAAPKTLRISPLAAPKITPRMIVSAWLLRVWSQRGASRCWEGRPTSARPRRPLLACPQRAVRARRTVFVTGSGRRRDLALSGAWGLRRRRGTKCYGIPHWLHRARAVDLLECGGAWLLRGNSVLFLFYANPPSRLPSDSENEFPGDSQHGRRQRMGMGTDGEKRRICC